MPKSIKLKDNTFLETQGIVHGRQFLSDILFSLVGNRLAIDLNEIKQTSVLIYNESTKNLPGDFANYGTVITLHQSFVQQICIGNWTISPNKYKLAIRTYANSKWTDWNFF